MQMNQAHATSSFAADRVETPFDNVWGNAMQREDFLLLAAGVRQFSIGMADMAFVTSTRQPVADHAQLSVE